MRSCYCAFYRMCGYYCAICVDTAVTARVLVRSVEICLQKGPVLPQFTMDNQKELFETYCKERYGGDDQLGTAPKSKTVTMEKGERIRKVLKNHPAAVSFCSKFKHWVKSRKFQLISSPH